VIASALALTSVGAASLLGGGAASAGTTVVDRLDPSTTSPGGLVTVQGDCTPPFLDSARVVLLSTTPGWTNLIFPMNTPDLSGGFSGSFTVPADAAPGSYTAQLQCGQSDSFTDIADLPLQVVAADTSTSTTTSTTPPASNGAVAAAAVTAGNPTFTG
jgi:hypothetical protein